MNVDYVNTPSDIVEAIEQAEVIADFLPSLYQLDLKEATGNRFDSFMVREKSPITNFEWDINKDHSNQSKHQVSFSEAQLAFMDSHRIVAIDHKHSTSEEKRYFCFGKVENRVLTVRFTYRADKIRIFGAGYWREGRKRYEQQKI